MKRLLVLIISTFFFIGCTENTPPTMYNLNVTSNPTDGGTINLTSGEYEEGTEVTITVTPNSNYEFDKWSGSWSGSESPLTITMDSDKNLVGNFKLSDTDGDGVTDDVDTCPDTPSDKSVDENGCSDSQKDSDKDGVNDDIDTCPDTPSGETVDENGCSDSQKDTDGDGISDDIDECNNTVSGRPVNSIGCQNPIYLDSNGVTIKSYEWGEVGDTGEVNGVTYTVVDETELRDIVKNHQDFSKICTSKVSNMSVLFEYHGFQPIDYDIKSWDVSNVTNMSKMFYFVRGNGEVSFCDISFWDVSKVENMSTMFEGFRGYPIDISSWNVGKVKNMSFMFKESCFFSDLSNWDVGNVENMSYMFFGINCHSGSLEDFDNISSWNVGKVKDMSYMFFDNGVFNEDISNWNVSSVTDMERMFGESNYSGDLSNWNVNEVVNCFEFGEGTYMTLPNFTNCIP